MEPVELKELITRFPQHRPQGIYGYLIAALLMALALALRLAIWPIDAGLQYVTFFPAVALTAVFAGFWPGMFTTALGVMFATFIFTHPHFSFSIEAIRNSLWSNIVFTIDGLVVCFSIEAMHRFRLKYAHELEATQRAHSETEQHRQQLQAIINEVVDGIITINETGIMESINKSALQIFGYDESEMLGKNVSMLMPDPYRSEHDGYIRNYLNTGDKKIIGIGREVVGMRKSGAIFPMELTVCEVQGKERLFSGVVRDISEHKAREEHMHHLAHHDQLTGLPNRILFNDRLQQVLAKAKRDNSKLTVLFIDLDRFKPINDIFGHGVGDQVLKEVTRRLLECLRESDTAARLGGDEFIALLLAIGAEEDAMVVAEKIRAAIEKPFTFSDQTFSISASIGAAIYPDHGTEGNQLITHADAAMYQAKRNGRNNVEFYRPSMD